MRKGGKPPSLKEQLEEEARRHEALLMEESRQEMLLREERMRQLKARWDLEEKSAVLLQAHARKINAKSTCRPGNRLTVRHIYAETYAVLSREEGTREKLTAQRKKRFCCDARHRAARMHIQA